MVACKLFMGGCVAALLALPAYAVDPYSMSAAQAANAPLAPQPSIKRVKKELVNPAAVRQTQYSSPNQPEWLADGADEESEAPQSTPQYAPRGHVTVLNGQQAAQPAAVQPETNYSPACPCDSGACSCPTCECDDCESDFWQHRNFAFGEYLYLKSYGPDFVHASQQNAAPAGVGTVPFGISQNLIQPWTSNFRVGGGYALSDCSSITATYTQFFSHTSDTLGLPAGTNVGSVISSVLAPGTVNAGTTFSQINAVSGINFRTADVMYSRLLAGGDNYYINFDVGARYAHLNQAFFQNAEFAQPNNPQVTSTNINFDGVGLRTGFDGRRRIGCGGLSAYGNGFVSLLFGDFNSFYNQTNSLTTALLATNTFESARVVPILEYELGVSWTNCSGLLRVSGGYYTAFWFNTVSNPQYIQAVQSNSFTKLGETMTFTGLVARAEVRF